MENEETATITVNKSNLKRDIGKTVLVALTGLAAERVASKLFDRFVDRSSDDPIIEIENS